MSNKFLTISENDIFSNPGETRSKLGLVFGQTVQSHSTKLDNISNLNFASNKIMKATGTNTFQLIDISTHGANALNSSAALLTNAALADYALTSAIPTNNTQLTNGRNFITNSADAFTYSNLSGKPTIPTNNNELTNGANFITNSADAYDYANLSGKPTNITTTDTDQDITAKKTIKDEIVIDQNNSGELQLHLNNGLGQNKITKLVAAPHASTSSPITISLPSVKAGASSDQLVSLNSTQTLTGKTISGSDNTFSNIPYSVITSTPTIPTNNNQLTNGAGFITNSADAFAYSNLSGKPTIPTNNNQLTNGANFITNSSGAFSYSNLSGAPTITNYATANNTFTGSHKINNYDLNNNAEIEFMSYTAGVNSADKVVLRNKAVGGGGYFAIHQNDSVNPAIMIMDDTSVFLQGLKVVGGKVGVGGVLGNPAYVLDLEGKMGIEYNLGGTALCAFKSLTTTSYSQYTRGFEFLNANGNSMMCILHYGTSYTDPRVGIGRTNPSHPLDIFCPSSSGWRVERTGKSIDSNLGIATGNYTYFKLGGNSVFRSGSGRNSTLEGTLSVNGSSVSSDGRIKKNIVNVDAKIALETLKKIPCREYEYRDTIHKSGKTIGFIAQEVREIIPNAVILEKRFTPNEMRHLTDFSWEKIVEKSTTEEDTVEEIVKYKLHTDLQDVSGVKYLFYVSNDPDGIGEEAEHVVGNSDNTFTFLQKYSNIFCYGKEVNDFHQLDKSKLFSLNFAATQELIRENEKLKNEMTAMKDDIKMLKAMLGL